MLSRACTEKKEHRDMILGISVTGLLNYGILDHKKLKQRIPYVTFKEMQGDGFVMTVLADYAKVIYQTQDSYEKGALNLILS